MYTLNDEWFLDHALSLVEEVGKAFGYSLVYLDACGCVGQEASWYIEKKDGYRRQIQLDELFHTCRDRHTLNWFRALPSSTL